MAYCVPQPEAPGIDTRQGRDAKRLGATPGEPGRRSAAEAPKVCIKAVLI